MMDEFETDDLDDDVAGKRSGFERRSWRPQIGKRLLNRIRLITSWLLVTVLPQYGWRCLGGMMLITAGRLTDAASFIVGTHILTQSLSHGTEAYSGFQSGLTLAAIGMAGVLTIGSLLSFLGSKVAVGISMDYENASLVQGMTIVASQQGASHKLSRQDTVNLTRQAPRIMSRSLWNIIHACTSLFMMLAGFVTCMVVFPVLTMLVILVLVLLSPIYIYAAVHSTNIGHHMRAVTAGYSASLTRLEKKWLNVERIDAPSALEEIRNDSKYNDYQSAHRARLILSSWNHLLSNLTLAIVIALSFVWIGNNVELTTRSIASVVSYLVALRLFAHGFGGIFHGMQTINASLPYFLLFLTHDPRLKKTVPETLS
ncbi:hypothetical protein [Microvirga sp. TS319]|uniref:hypothetical protein n=1 Tax=Microvirga sp. TS319 TaxID=3241165 RepID=UPI00351A35AD